MQSNNNYVKIKICRYPLTVFSFKILWLHNKNKMYAKSAVMSIACLMDAQKRGKNNRTVANVTFPTSNIKASP